MTIFTAMVLLLGKLPEPWWTTWEGRKDCFEDEVDEQGRAIKIAAITSPAEESEGNAQEKSTTQTPLVQDPRSIREALIPGLRYTPGGPGSEIHRHIREEEIEVFADLLGRLLTCNPEDRLSAQEVLDHEWFRM